jgi:long-chain fatty acid transport protein
LVTGKRAMKHIITLTGALALTTTLAQAGALDHTGQSVAVIFEQGNYVELSFGHVTPHVSGTAIPGLGGFDSGNMAKSYSQVGMAVKTKLNENLDLAVIFDQPFGANVSYPTGTSYFAAGSTAKLSTADITTVLKYRTANNVSFYGGLRYELMDAKATVPFVASYDVASDQSAGLGYVIGVAYEKPEIALRVALTYNSKISHDFNTTESSLLTGGLPVAGTTSTDSPQSVNLEFQSGVAKDTLVFGSIRWVDWTSFVIDPAGYPAPSPLVAYDSDIVTYTLGVGRKFNDHWAGSIALGFEDQVGGFASNLGPTDGRASVTIGAAYTADNKMKISGGISYVRIGDAQTTLDGTNAASNFTGNHALGAGIKVSYSF